MRGQAADIGDTNVSQNGYHYTRTEKGWQLTHHLIAERKLGRQINTETEQVRFADGNRKNLKPDNIIVVEKGKANLRTQRARLEARIEELQAQLHEINERLGEA